MAKKDLPVISGKLEDLVIDIQESWSKWGWIFVVMNVILAGIVTWDILKKRMRK